jgi:GTP pyrophosphokinase
MVPLQYELKTGDVVSIITSKNHHPSKDWLNFVKTVKARSRIRQWIKIQEKDQSIVLGREMCEREFQKHRLSFTVEVKSDRMAEVVAHFGFKTVDDLIASVGYGKITPLQIVRKIVPKSELETLQESIINKFIGRVKKKKPQAGVVVKGVDDVLLKFGKCCQPVPGDSITGYITRGYGITVHRTNCVNALKLNPERQIEVEWSTEITETYPVKIRVRSYDRVGLLADIAEGISKNGSNILYASTETNDIQDVDSFFTISVENTEHLRRVLSTIKKVKHVHEVKRIA